ncbi:hypothetical protein [Streptomyces galbus]|uniref:Nuclear transport factor 2 family protein n=1 Tax=Streptomyces galbus TaxID=33898 RepID=A0ABX1IBF2_STRGB|nr:hypothetical protein [Streptomyces galbus]NKQ23011.1 hypothetical protein [Streptomyces galbus]
MNSKPSAARRPGRRAAVATALALAVGLGVSAQVSAQASVAAPVRTATAAPRPVTGTQGQAVTRVADFYGAYIDARGDYTDPDATLATALRAHYLTPEFAARLAAWENANGADGVLRAQNVPTRWTVSDNGAVGNGHEVVVTLTFGSGGTARTTKLFVLLERYDRVIDIKTTSSR